jgi:probable HAF family extracellular repeat protein
MRDIGGLGGTCTLAEDINNRGQIVGISSLAGDQTAHPFVWEAATGITDLMGASNGFSGYAHAINDGGQIVGIACDAVTCYAVLWQKSGGKWQETDLGIFAVGDCPNATSVNASAQVVGTDYCYGPFLSEDGAGIVDLNTLVPSNSGLQLNETGQINDRGEITVNATDANLNNHSVVLIPRRKPSRRRGLRLQHGGCGHGGGTKRGASPHSQHNATSAAIAVESVSHARSRRLATGLVAVAPD